MIIRITRHDFIEAGGNAKEFYKEYRAGQIIPDAILNIVTERYRGYGQILTVIPKDNESVLEVDIR